MVHCLYSQRLRKVGLYWIRALEGPYTTVYKRIISLFIAVTIITVPLEIAASSNLLMVKSGREMKQLIHTVFQYSGNCLKIIR